MAGGCWLYLGPSDVTRTVFRQDARLEKGKCLPLRIRLWKFVRTFNCLCFRVTKWEQQKFVFEKGLLRKLAICLFNCDSFFFSVLKSLVDYVQKRVIKKIQIFKRYTCSVYKLFEIRFQPAFCFKSILKAICTKWCLTNQIRFFRCYSFTSNFVPCKISCLLLGRRKCVK